MNKNLTKRKQIIIILICLWFIHLCLFLYKPNGMQANIFFGKCSNFMADYFNCLIYISDKNPYYNNLGPEHEKIYLPFSYIILYPFTKLCDYKNMTLTNCWSNKIALISALFFSFISIITYFFSLIALCNEIEINKRIVLLILISGVFWFSIERGNLILISASTVNFFIAYYNSKKRKLQIIADISIIIASLLKIYPFFFTLLLIKNKLYKNFKLVTIFFIFIPFLFFENGLLNIQKLLTNVAINSEIYKDFNRISPKFGAGYLVFQILDKLDILSNFELYIISNAVDSFITVLSIFAIILSLFIKNDYNSILLLSLCIIFIPSNSSYYCSLYLIPVVLLYYKNSQSNNYQFEDIAFVLLLSPLQYKIFNIDNYLFLNLSLIILLQIRFFAELKKIRILLR